MDKIITHALFVTLLCALLGACGGGGDDEIQCVAPATMNANGACVEPVMR